MQCSVASLAACLFTALAARVPTNDAPPKACEAELPIFKDKGARKAASEVLTKALPDYLSGQFKDWEVTNAVDNSTKSSFTEGCAEDSYGEIPLEYANGLFSHVKATSADSFADLGSGLGRVTIEAAVIGGMKRAVGVELSKQRHEMACKGLSKAKKELDEIPGKAGSAHVELRQGDFLKFDLSGFTLVFASTICFRDTLMEHLGAKLAKELPAGARFAATTDFPKTRPPPRRMVKQEAFKAGYDYYLHLYRAKSANTTDTNTTGENITLLQRRLRF